MRRKIVAGNWKMNNDLPQTEALIDDIIRNLPRTNAEIMIAPAFVNLYSAYKLLRGTPVKVIAQNMHFAENGAYTGEISAPMLQSIGINTVILGHSERRAYFNEDNAMLAKKIDAALSHNMSAIFCFGEELKDRKSNNHFTVVEHQLKEALFHVSASDFKHIILAYEPVWAIGTGETASPEQAQEMHAFVRGVLAKKFGEDVANSVSILYGGSVKPNNAKQLFMQPDVDGGLIGGASLNAQDFIAIINAI